MPLWPMSSRAVRVIQCKTSISFGPFPTCFLRTVLSWTTNMWAFYRISFFTNTYSVGDLIKQRNFLHQQKHHMTRGRNSLISRMWLMENTGLSIFLCLRCWVSGYVSTASSEPSANSLTQSSQKSFSKVNVIATKLKIWVDKLRSLNVLDLLHQCIRRLVSPLILEFSYFRVVDDDDCWRVPWQKYDEGLWGPLSTTVVPGEDNIQCSTLPNLEGILTPSAPLICIVVPSIS